MRIIHAATYKFTDGVARTAHAFIIDDRLIRTSRGE